MDTSQNSLIKYLFLWAGLSALLYTLGRGDFVSMAYTHTINRDGDYVSPVLHILQGTLSETHPVFRATSEIYHRVLPGQLLSLLASSGINFYYAVAIIYVFVRVINIFFIIPWLYVTKISPWYGFFILPVVFAQEWYTVMGYLPWLPATAIIGPALFMSACGFLLINRTKASLVFLAAHAWSHPTTFVSWLPLYIVLFLFQYGLLDTRKGILRWIPASWTWRHVAIMALVVLPPLGGFFVGFLERLELIRTGADAYYWDFVISRSHHSIYGGARQAYVEPLNYLLVTCSLLLMSLTVVPITSRIKDVNKIFASMALGFFLLHLSCVETQQSVLVNMLVPLRFDTLLIMLLIVNMFALLLPSSKIFSITEKWQYTCIPAAKANAAIFLLLFFVSGRYGYMFFLPVPILLTILCTICFESLLSEKKFLPILKKNIEINMSTLILLLFAILTFVFSVLLLFNRTGFITIIYVFFINNILIIALICFTVLIFSFTAMLPRKHMSNKLRNTTCIVFSVCVLVFVFMKVSPNIYNVNAIKKEISLLTSGVTAEEYDTPWRSLLAWYNQNVYNDDQMLVHPGLYLGLLGMTGTSVDFGLLAHSIYAPHTSHILAQDMRELFGLDVKALAHEGKYLWLPLKIEGWENARQKYLLNENNAPTRSFQYMVEPKEHPHLWDYNYDYSPIPGSMIAFENDFVRVYRLGD